MAMIQNTSSSQQSPRLFSADEEQVATEALTALHLLVGNDGHGKALGDKVLHPDTIRQVSDRVVKAMIASANERRRQAEAGIRAAIAEIVAPFAEEHEAQRAEYAAMSDALRARLGGFPSSYNVPCAALKTAFDDDLTVEQTAERLKGLGFTIACLANKLLTVKMTPAVQK